ncbi:MAG: 16S rRNA (guanine(527)-N(7))-methyltransferase RsmG [Micromonosporaceae bacterium]
MNEPVRPAVESPVPVPEPLREAVAHYFGAGTAVVSRYAERLATDGVVRGLIGPREVPRLWERHLLNSVALVELLDDGASVADVGTGAGLPGVVLGIARPDLEVVLVEPLLRRTTFLEEVVRELELDRVTVLRGRAEEVADQVRPADVVVSRAVAPLDRLAAWCLPLAAVGGRMLAMKGASAGDELQTHRDAVRKVGGGDPVLLRCGGAWLESPVTVVEVVREADRPRKPRRRSGTRRRGR